MANGRLSAAIERQGDVFAALSPEMDVDSQGDTSEESSRRAQVRPSDDDRS